MAIYYLEIDDEITSAAARIRDSSDDRIALVLSGGARVATSRINFRLLAGEARRRNKRLAIIAADPSVQSVARSADLPVYTSVGDYERAEAALSRGVAGRSSVEVTDALDGPALTAGSTVGAGQAGRGGVTRVPAGQSVSGPRRGQGLISRSSALVVAVLVVILVAAGGFFLYPSATVTVTLHGEPLGPMTLNITVDPSVSAADDQTGTVPGLSKSFPVEASGTFNATGQNVVETAATGTVTFSSNNTYLAVPILAGTQVTTASGIAFVTASTVTVPTATVSGQRITPGTREVAVTAVDKGLSGNVAAGTIINVPPSLASALVGVHPVTNKNPTTGGTHSVTPQVQQSDIDGAEASILAQMTTDFKDALVAPGAVPSGYTLFTASARLGVATCSPDAAGLLNQDVASFQLDCQADGTATLTDMATVRSLAGRRIQATVRTGYTLVENSITTSVGVSIGGRPAVVVPVTVRAEQVPIVDVNQLRGLVLGKSVADARSLLSQYGQVDIAVSPGWASTMPSFDFRIDILIVIPSAQPSTGASPSAGSSPTEGPVVPTATLPPATPVAPSSAVPSPSGPVPASPTTGVTESPSAGSSASPSTAPSGAPSAVPTPVPSPSA
jgi:hypothetical protein